MQANRHSFLQSKRVRSFASKYAKSIGSSSSISSTTTTTDKPDNVKINNQENNSFSKSYNVLSQFNNTEDDANLTRVLSQYQSHLNKVHEILLQMLAINDESPWQLAPTFTTLQGKCHDGNEITHEYKGQQAIFQTSEATRFKQMLEQYRDDINPALYQCLFEAKLARITTQALIDDTLWSLQSRPQLRTNAGRNQVEQHQEQDLLIIRRLLRSLFAAEQLYSNTTLSEGTLTSCETETTDIETEEVSAFIKDVRTWILLVSAAYLRLAPLQDRIILLLHLLQSPGITQWATPLIQYMYQRDDYHWSKFMEEYLIMLSLLLDHSHYQQHGDMKPPQWNEDDYLAALDQLGIVYVFDTLCATVLRQQQYSNNHQALFLFADQLITVLNIGIRTFTNHQYTNATKRLAQVICQVAQVLMDRVMGSNTSGSTSNRTIKGELMVEEQKLQQSTDEFLTKVVDGYLQTQDAKIWHFLPALPFHAVSIHALWKIVLSLLDIDDYTEPQDLQHALENLPDISKILAFLEESQIQGVFLLGCLSNVVTSISITPTTNDQDTKDHELASCLIAIVAYTLFTTAFVDSNLREIYYKDVRDSFGSICISQPFTISLLLRWTVSNFDTMEGMAIYLFRSLPLSRWKLLQSDLVLLHELLAEGGGVSSNNSSGHNNTTSIKTTFARYVIEHLNYGYDDEKQDPVLSNSQPWHTRKRPFLPYAIHEEFAFMLIDILRLHCPLPDSDKNANLIKAVGTSVSFYLPARTQQFLTTAASRMASPSPSSSTRTSSSSTTDHSVIEWSWKIALQLKLYDCALSDRATDIENSITSVFIKDMLHGHTDSTASHGALLVYISFLLSPTGRHFLRFESGNGWDKLLLILRRGRPEAVIQILSDIIPTFFYMHGDDFFNDENVLHFLRQMTDFKTDPMLVHAVDMWIPSNSKETLFRTDMSGIAMMIGSHVWHGMFIDSIDQISQDKKNTSTTGNIGGFSYRDLVIHSWIKTLFSKKEWMWNDHFVSVMDCICKVAFCLRRHDLVRDMLREEQKRLQHNRQQTGSPKLSPPPGHQQQLQRNPLRMIKNMLPDAAYASLLAGEWSLASVTTNNLFRTPGVEQDSLWFAFDVLTLETINEEEERAAVAEACANTDDLMDMDITAVMKLHEMHVEKPIDFFTIYRWLQHILVCPAEHPLMPLFLQMFFSLYYANFENKGRRIFYGHIFFAKKQDMIEKLRDRIAYLQTYHGQQQTDSNHVKGEAEGGKQRSVTSVTSGSGEDRSVYHEDLRRVYYAMWLWLDKSELLDPTYDMSSLPKHYCPELLQSCRLMDNAASEEKKIKPWQDIQLLWRDYVQYDQLGDMFNEFPWIGSNKFRSTVQQADTQPKPHHHLIKQHTVHPPHILSQPDLQLTKPAQILSSTELLSSLPETLLGSTIETLSQHAKRFHEHLEQQRTLDIAYVEKLAALYMNKSGSKHVEASCGKRCKKPAEWDIIISYAQKDEAVAEQLKENRKQVATRYIFRSVDARICIQALLAFRKFDAIVDQAKQGKKQNGPLVQLGWSCLQYVLKSVSRHDMERFPPARIVVLHMSRALGEAIVDDASYISKFFDLINEDNQHQQVQQRESIVQLVYPTFKPHSDNKHLPAILDRVLRHRPDTQLYLLPRFDMATWTKSSYANETARGTVYSSLFLHLKPAIIQLNEPLYQQYCDLVLSLMETSGKSKKLEPVKVLEFIIKLLVDTIQHSKADGRSTIVNAFTTRIKESERTNGETLATIATFLGNTFNLSKNDPHLYKTYTNSIPALCQLLHNVFNNPRFTERQKDAPAFVWRHVNQCFHSWWKSSEDRGQDNQYSNVFAQTYHSMIQYYLDYFDLPGRAKLLNWIFGYYHERLLQLPSSSEDRWIEYYGDSTTSKLNWGYLDLSVNHLRRIHQAWSSLNQQSLEQQKKDTQQECRRSIYVNYIWRVLSSWMTAHPQPTNLDKDSYGYIQVAFIFVQDGESVWPEASKERKDALQQLWSVFCRRHKELSVEQVSSIIRQLRRHWNHPLPLPSAASNDLFFSICIDWVRRLTCFNEQKAPMRRRRLFVYYILKLLPEGDTDMQKAWIQHIYQVVNEHTPSEARGEDFEETILLVSNMLPLMHEEIPPGGNSCMLTAVFGALSRLPVSFETVGFMENALEQYMMSIATVSSADWCRLGELLSRSNPDYSLFLQYCLDQSAFLTMRVYGEAKLQQECGGALQDPARLANLAEEVAAVISIAKVDRKAAVHLVKFFATLFCRSKQQESRLLASIVSLSRTASRWVNAHQHSPKPHLGNEWHVFATLLDGFLASRLIARGVLSPVPTSVDWVKRIELIRADKKYKPFHTILSRGIEITKDGDRWTIWQLDQVVTEFAQALWIS